MAQEGTNSKIIFYGETLIDLTGDTVEDSKVLSGIKYHKPDGSQSTGACTFDSDTSTDTAAASEILSGKTAHVGGNKLTGTMANIGAQSAEITSKTQEVTITQGYHDGSGKAKINSTEQAKIIAGNIKNGVSILGIMGTYTGSDNVRATTGSGTPSATSQTILPSNAGNYDYFTQFTIAAIPYNRTVNSSGGYTVTIGA